MTRQALVALAPKTLLPLILVGGAAIGLAAWMWPHAEPQSYYRLTLHAPRAAGAYYVSAWNDGDVIAVHQPLDGKRLVYTRHGQEHDGCTWLGTEWLTPIAPTAYEYSYEEHPIRCQPGARLFTRTPRQGIVLVEKLPGVARPTPFDAEQAPVALVNRQLGCGCNVHTLFFDDRGGQGTIVFNLDDDDDAMTRQIQAQVAEALRQASEQMEAALHDEGDDSE